MDTVHCLSALPHAGVSSPSPEWHQLGWSHCRWHSLWGEEEEPGGFGGLFQSGIMSVFGWHHVNRRAPCHRLLFKGVYFIVPIGQLKLSIDAQDRVLLLHSEYGYVQVHQGRRGWFLWAWSWTGMVSLWHLVFSYRILPFVH